MDKELEELIITKRHHEIVDVLKVIDENISDIVLGRNRMIYVDIGMERMIPLNLLGDGVRRIMMVILSIYNAKGGIVVIDEIESGLHYGVLKSLWRSVLRIANETNVQLFITTHNHETIKYLWECLNESDYVSYQEITKVFTIRKLEEGNHKAYKYDFDQLENAINEQFELR